MYKMYHVIMNTNVAVEPVYVVSHTCMSFSSCKFQAQEREIEPGNEASIISMKIHGSRKQGIFNFGTLERTVMNTQTDTSRQKVSTRCRCIILSC